MHVWKKTLLGAYYYGTQPYRAVHNYYLRATGQAPVIVLFYHRVADDHGSPWTLSTRTFERQMQWLKRHFDMVPLIEAQRRISLGCNGRPSVTITFDDGYADNCDSALPLLIQHKIPCTYFVTSQNILHDVPFAHDVARGRADRPNTPRQIHDLARAGIDIGVHSRTHANLGRITDSERLYDEVVAARDEIQEITGTWAEYFAFPFGQRVNLNPEVFRLARDAGFLGVCSAYGGFNMPGDDAFHLQRIAVDDDMIRLKNWVTGDPRKVVKRYEYDFEEREQAAEALGGCA